jgi:[ribosomal protein S5]-alanine N-acetyltransferase
MTAPTLEAFPARLRPLRMEDAEALFPAFSDAAVMRYWSGAPHADVIETRADVAWWLETNPDAAFAIEDPDGAVAGRCGLYRVRDGVREVGVLLHPDYVGKGIASAAVRSLCGFGFSVLGLHRIVADIDPDNVASIRLFEACGFVYEGRFRHNWRTHLGLRDSVIYAQFPEGL